MPTPAGRRRAKEVAALSAAARSGIEPTRTNAAAWRAAGLCLVVAGTVVLVVLLLFTPRFGLWRGLNTLGAPQIPEYGRARVTLKQLEEPWTPVVARLHRVASWRLLFPLTWHYLSLPAWLLMAMPYLGCVLAVWLAAWLNYRRLHNWWKTCLATALFGALPWFWVSTGWLTYFDSWFVLGSLTVAFVPSRWTLAGACLLTPWIDERFVLALLGSLLIRAVALEWSNKPRRDVLLDLAVAAAASFPYPAVRAVAWLRDDPTATAYVQSHWIEAQTVSWDQYLDGLWSGFRAGWLMIVAALVLAPRKVGRPWGMALVTVVTLSAVGSLFVAEDMSRSLMIICPVLLLGVWLWEQWRPATLRYVLAGVVAANLLLPAAHVMWNHKMKISALPTEIDRWRTAPAVFAPYTAAELLKEATQLISAGNRNEGSKKLEMSIGLDGKNPRAFVQRAVLRMDDSDYASAESDLDEALRLNANDPNALFLRGVVHGSRGEAALAADDFRRALECAPANWPARADVEEHLRQAMRRSPPGAASTNP